MAKVVWTEPALSDLDAIADYNALDNQAAAGRLVQRIFERVAQLEQRLESGSVPSELRGLPCRQIVEVPCRIFYRNDGDRVLILYVMRAERQLRSRQLRERD